MCLLCDDTGERQSEELWNNYICHLHNENVCMQDIAPKQLLPHRCWLFLTNRILIGPDPNSSSTGVELGKNDSCFTPAASWGKPELKSHNASLSGFEWSVYPAQAIIQYYWIANGWIDVSMVTYKKPLIGSSGAIMRWFFFFYCLNNLVYICKTEDTPISLRCAIRVLVIVMKHNALMYLRIGSQRHSTWL